MTQEEACSRSRSLADVGAVKAALTEPEPRTGGAAAAQRIAHNGGGKEAFSHHSAIQACSGRLWAGCEGVRTVSP
jgi:hypothetical protein